MAAPMKRIKLEEMRTIMGNPFRETVLDEDGMPILELRKDSEGNPVKQVPRDAKGEVIPNVQPEPVYQVRTKVVKRALPVLLKRLYLNMPQNKTTRLDTITGTRMFDDIANSPDGYLELHEDIHDWIMEKLKDKETVKDGVISPGIGLAIFDKNLQIVERAMDNFERLHERQEKAEVVEEFPGDEAGRNVVRKVRGRKRGN